MDALALLRLELDTLWVTDPEGRLLHCRTETREPPPRLVVGSCAAGVAWAASTAVSEATRARIAALLDEERPAGDVGWAPSRADDLADALTASGPLGSPHGGPSYVVPAPLDVRPGLDLRSSAQTDVAALPALPEADRTLCAPWVAAVAEGRVAAVCETARSGSASVEAGVWTYEPFRRRGLAAAVTAAWSTLVRDRTAFYSTSWENVASQAVARRLALHPLGHWWQLSPAPASE